MKVIPVYLPQFHAIPENDEWWGKGFTEWTNVKGAQPLFEGHNQPRVPLNDNYYDLSELETLKWQCEMAKDHGVYGFCMYHYWMNGKLLLHGPMEMLLAHPEIDINYCISWANHDWTDGWRASGRAPRTLIAHNFDDEQDWVDHFNYMLPFFKDSRYMKEDNKPYMIIYIPNIIGKLNKMVDLWSCMAVEAGFAGLTFIYQSATSAADKSWDRSKFAYGVETNPGYANIVSSGSGIRYPRLMKYSRIVKRLLGIRGSLAVQVQSSSKVRRVSYDATWEKILNIRPTATNMIPSAFTDWDNTPRHKERGVVYEGSTPEKFEGYFRRLVANARCYYNTDMIFVFAWNEWAEGGYLEPDTRWGSGYLEAIKRVLDDTTEGIG